MERILVTGATGFIGSQLCRVLGNAGYEVVGAVRDSRSNQTSCSRLVRIGDVGPDTDWSEALKEVSAVVHLAGHAHRMEEPPGQSAGIHERVNTQGTLKLASQALDAGVRRLVFMSTVKVNGETSGDRQFSEADDPHPVGPYATSKWRAEDGLKEIAAKSRLEIVVIRPPLVYGPGVRANFLALLRAVDRGVPLPLACIENKRSLVGVRNLAHMVECCVSHPGAAGNVFFVSDETDISTPELIRAIARVLDRPARLIPVPLWLVRGALGLVGKSESLKRLALSLTVSTATAREVLQWTPRYSLSDELNRTGQWYIKHFR
ncbi:MAG: NAD-dependent epimerase/dehydratase family protein [Desulfomonile tiedjei]|nr:NAD-dependent epimerase/dehydratase family protein [Desulfomonile tiedjei]